MTTTHHGERRAALMTLLALVAGIALLLLAEARALAASTNCAVNASVGYVNCLSQANPSFELAKAHHAAGLPYRFQLYRPSDGARWGYWQWNDLDYHQVSLGLAGSITAQVDNLGSANPASYYVEMG